MATDLITDVIRPADLKPGMSIINLGKVIQGEENSNLVRVLIDHFETIEAEWILFPKFQHLVIQIQMVAHLFTVAPSSLSPSSGKRLYHNSVIL